MRKNQWTNIDNLINQHCIAETIAGAVVMVIQQGSVLHHSSIGMMDIEIDKPMQLDTIFRIASMTKPITAVAVLMLADEGHFGLDDPIVSFMPEFAETKLYNGQDNQSIRLAELDCDITIRHLLTHTSGLCLGAGGTGPVEQIWTDAIGEMMKTPGTTLQSAVRMMAELPLASQPGTAWRYGLSFEVLAALVEIVTGEWFDQFLQQRIFGPLGMVDSGYVIQPKNASRLSALYASNENSGLSLVEAPGDSPHVLMHNYESGTGWTTGGDMLVSTSVDYSRFLQMLLNGGELEGERLLEAETVADMIRSQIASFVLRGGTFEPGYGQGLAVKVLQDVGQSGDVGYPGQFTHAGGHGTYFWVDPRAELIGLLMLQLNPVPESLHRQVRAMVYQAIS